MQKHYKKIFFVAMIFMLIFTLASCGGNDEVGKVIVNNPYGQAGEKLVFDYEERNSIIFKGDNGLSYWTLSEAGIPSEEAIAYEGLLPSNVSPDEIGIEGGVQTFTFSVQEKEVSFKIYIKPETVVEDNEIAMIAFRFLTTDGVLYQMGQTFEPKDIEAYAVQKDGDIIKLHEVLSEEAYAAAFNDFDYDPLGTDGFKNQVSFPVSFTYENHTETFEAYVAGGEKPITTEDAGFFDYILVIPVAFIMQLFAGFLGNSFALGILFTTLVVRTLAWPIYAKSNDMTMKMNLAQPDMQRVQAKYAARKDPQSQQMMQMEMMQVYKKHNINVLGCLMPFLQMPIFIAMYGVVRRISLEGGMYADKVSNTNFLGINLANTNDGITALLLAAIVGATMFTLQKISMKKPSYAKNTYKHNANPQAQQTEKTMKFVSYFMVIMMMFISYQSNALALYWIFGNIYSLGQTLFNRKLNEKKHAKLQEKQLLG
ncbi:MAG: membrane protein insertase YidC [Acholeplasmataceae bacterium]